MQSLARCRVSPFILSTHGTFLKINYVLGYKGNLVKTVINIHTVFSDYSAKKKESGIGRQLKYFKCLETENY